MKLLSLVHRWAGGLIGLLLAVIALSGTTLLWEGQWVTLPHAADAVTGDPAAMIAAARNAERLGATRVTFASDEIGLHHVALEDGAGRYVSQQGETVAVWKDQWQRPEWWLFDLHHHLFAGHRGEQVTGIAGLVGILFVVTGSILWWRSRRNFRWPVWPRPFRPGPIVRHHRDLGILAAPLLLVSFLTGTLMIYDDAAHWLLNDQGPVDRKVPTIERAEGDPIEALFSTATTLYPAAAPRRLSFPGGQEGYVLRLRQPFEWTPNGRTSLRFDAAGRLTAIEVPRGFSPTDALYPVHSAKVGGTLWRLAMTVSGVALAMLGLFATWSFWRRRVR